MEVVTARTAHPSSFSTGLHRGAPTAGVHSGATPLGVQASPYSVPPPTPETPAGQGGQNGASRYDYRSSWDGVISFFHNNYLYHVNQSASSTGALLSGSGALSPLLEASSSSAAAAVADAASVAAIDNKIEQAMDLVKTHLTYAVREEVDVLRATIDHLKNKISVLEHQNQLLRQCAPADVLANLASLTAAQLNNNNNGRTGPASRAAATATTTSGVSAAPSQNATLQHQRQANVTTNMGQTVEETSNATAKR